MSNSSHTRPSQTHSSHATAPGGLTAYTTVGNSLMRMRRPLPRRLLGVWAHPDDEAYLSAGLMARVVDAGGSVTVVSATRGEKGTDDPDRFDSEDFARLRAAELKASLARLGVTDVQFLGRRDGECDVADDATAVDAIASVIAEVQPDTIVTFGPDGITNHPDHRAISRWTTEAWRRVGIAELRYAAMTHDHVTSHRTIHERLGVFADFGDGRPRSVDRSLIALECSLTEAELDRKRAALAEHATQTAGLAELIGEAAYRTWWRDERFRAPTASDVARCELPAWIQDATFEQRRLVGASR